MWILSPATYICPNPGTGTKIFVVCKKVRVQKRFYCEAHIFRNSISETWNWFWRQLCKFCWNRTNFIRVWSPFIIRAGIYTNPYFKMTVYFFRLKYLKVLSALWFMLHSIYNIMYDAYIILNSALRFYNYYFLLMSF